MKKIIVSALLIACVLSTQQVDAALINTNAIEGDSCVKFTENLYYAKDTWLRTVAGYTNLTQYDELSSVTERQVKRLHLILEKEGFEIPSKEKNINQFGRGTAIAVAGLQNKYKAELLTSQGLTYSYGVIDEKGVEFLNQKYGCVDKVSVKFQQEGKTFEVKAGADQSIGYVITGVPNKVKIDFSVVDPSNTESALSSVEMKNGKGILEWKAPANRGTYVIRAKIQGTLFSQVTYQVLGTAGLSGVTTESTWTKNDGTAQKVTFTRTDLKGPVYACLVESTATANGTVVNGVLLGATGNNEVSIPDSKISGVVPGQYKVLVTNSSKKCETDIAMTAISGVITVATKSNIVDNATRTFTISSDINSVKVGKVIKVKIDGNFDKSEDTYSMVVELKQANGELITLGVHSISSLKQGRKFKIPSSIPAGSYYLVGTYSYNGNPVRYQSTTPLVVEAVGSSNTTSNTSGTGSTDSTTGSNTSGLDTSITGSVDNSRTFEFVRPTADTSVKAGANLGLRIRIGSVENIPNRARGSAYLIDPNGTETKLKEGYIYYCATATSDCVGYRSPYGLSATVPAGTAAGSGYKVRLDIPVDGVTVSKTSPTFTVTN